jgi:hypothetical protein
MDAILPADDPVADTAAVVLNAGDEVASDTVVPSRVTQHGTDALVGIGGRDRALAPACFLGPHRSPTALLAGLPRRDLATERAGIDGH